MLTHPKPYRYESVSLDDLGSVDIPFFTPNQLPDNYCARYARLAAEAIFGKRFPVADAWHMRKQKGVVTINTNDPDFMQLVGREAIRPGMMIGVYRPDSDFNRRDRDYTHVALYLGLQNGVPLLIEQCIGQVRTVSLDRYQQEGFGIREAIDVRK